MKEAVRDGIEYSIGLLMIVACVSIYCAFFVIITIASIIDSALGGKQEDFRA